MAEKGESEPGLASRPDLPSATGALVVVVLAWAAIFVVRLFGPSDLLDNDQERPSSYVVDALRNGDWVVQRDWTGDVASKPPLHTWIAAGAMLFSPRAELFPLQLPSALAVLGVALLVVHWGGRLMGPRAGFCGALVWLLSTLAFKHVALIRTDALFGFLTFLTFLLAFRAWTTGRGRLAVWGAALASTLTKGPLGLLLVGAGLLLPSRWIGQGRGASLRRLLHPGGMLLLLLAAGGWFLIACLVEGTDVVEKMLGRELVGHAVADGRGRQPFQNPHKPTFYFVTRFLPWSPLALYALWRVFLRPAPKGLERRFERALTGYFLFGLALFSIAPHQRPDHLVPLVPAAALLTGRELDRLLARWNADRLLVLGGLATLLAVVPGWIWYGEVRAGEEDLRRTAALEKAALAIERRHGLHAPLAHLDTPYVLQFHLDTMRRRVDADQAAALLLTSAQPVATDGAGSAELERRLGEGRFRAEAFGPEEADVRVLIPSGFAFPEAATSGRGESWPRRLAGSALLLLALGVMLRAALRGLRRTRDRALRRAGIP